MTDTTNLNPQQHLLATDRKQMTSSPLSMRMLPSILLLLHVGSLPHLIRYLLTHPLTQLFPSSLSQLSHALQLSIFLLSLFLSAYYLHNSSDDSLASDSFWKSSVTRIQTLCIAAGICHATLFISAFAARSAYHYPSQALPLKLLYSFGVTALSSCCGILYMVAYHSLKNPNSGRYFTTYLTPSSLLTGALISPYLYGTIFTTTGHVNGLCAIAAFLTTHAASQANVLGYDHPSDFLPDTSHIHSATDGSTKRSLADLLHAHPMQRVVVYCLCACVGTVVVAHASSAGAAFEKSFVEDIMFISVAVSIVFCALLSMALDRLLLTKFIFSCMQLSVYTCITTQAAQCIILFFAPRLATSKFVYALILMSTGTVLCMVFVNVTVLMPSVVGEANSMLAHAIAIMALVVGASLVCGLCNVFEETGGCIIAMGCGACGMVCLGLRKWDDAFKEACEKGYARFAGVVAVEYGAV